ncbi:LuxR C-terminal-related transcriptional regulator [Streptomyces griseofuscus]|uniref:LuxR C-terminal-related transcriptional regulator n=1 Tax=Streptomyces griseofuscus TaxID=146922 RepID=UPI0036AE8B8D
MQLTVYRIVQEAMTNTLKHAGAGTRVDLAIDIGADRLGIQVRDTGRTVRSGRRHDGQGLLGMRERVALYGGHLSAGPAPGGGWTVAATLELLMDIRMPGMDGIEATRRIVATGARSRVLVLTTFDLDEYVHAALRSGASGFLVKDARPDELLAGIRAVAGGDAVIAPALTRRLLDEFARYGSAPTDAPRVDRLTEREREILVAIGEGWTNGEIAARLVLSESTVKTHVGGVLAKTGARDRVQAVIFAYDLGLARPSVR